MENPLAVYTMFIMNELRLALDWRSVFILYNYTHIKDSYIFSEEAILSADMLS